MQYESPGRRVLVCGGRDYRDWRAVADTLTALHASTLSYAQPWRRRLIWLGHVPRVFV